MNTPRFTAEATLYHSATPYRSNGVTSAKIGFNVAPQVSIVSPTFLCEIKCRREFGSDLAGLRGCLDECNDRDWPYNVVF